MRPNRSAWRPPRRIAVASGLILLGLIGAAVAATTLRGGSTPHLSAPRGFSSRLDGASAVRLSWHKPSSGAVDGYRVFRDGQKIAIVERTGYVDRGLSSLTRYVYSVRAFHGGKVGPSSARAAVRTPDPTANVESPYPPPRVFAKAGKGSALVRWQKPESNGGKPITNYIVTAYVSGIAKRSATVGNVTSTTIDQLVNGKKYTFKVAAKNAVGTGVQSAASNPVRPNTPGKTQSVITTTTVHVDTVPHVTTTDPHVLPPPCDPHTHNCP